MSITVLNYMDHALVSRINEQAAKRVPKLQNSLIRMILRLR